METVGLVPDSNASETITLNGYITVKLFTAKPFMEFSKTKFNTNDLIWTTKRDDDLYKFGLTLCLKKGWLK